MIPRRICLAGFLSYREEQAFDFDGAPICMLSGPNGSGKSSVFDAVTFALYGAHRGGKQGADELITKGRDALRVEFDFEVAGALYRIHRSARRKGGPTRQAFAADGNGGWLSIPDTHLETGFDAWVRDQVGLTYEAFTSSVLLLQGRAEKLISAKPSERLVVLKEIVGLDRFERLHARVADQSRLSALRAEDFRVRLMGIPAVADGEISNAEKALQEAESARTTALAAVDHLIGLEHRAREAARLRAEADDLRAWLDRAGSTLAEADAIDLGMARLAELRAALPHLESTLARRRSLAEADAAARTQRDRLRRLEEDAAAADAARQALRARLDDLQASIPAAERSFESLRDRLAEAARLAERAERCRRRAAQVADLAEQLARFAADLDAQAEAADSEVARLDAADRALPALKRLAHARGELRRALREAQSTRAALADAGSDSERARIDHDASAARHAEASAAHRRAETQAETARIARAKAVRDRRLLDDLAGRPDCDRCGQPLTPAHLDDERARRDAEVAAAASAYQSARDALDAAQRALETGQADLDGSRRRLDEASARVTSQKHALDRHERDIERYSLDCATAFAELPDAFGPLVLPAGAPRRDPVSVPGVPLAACPPVSGAASTGGQAASGTRREAGVPTRTPAVADEPQPLGGSTDSGWLAAERSEAPAPLVPPRAGASLRSAASHTGIEANGTRIEPTDATSPAPIDWPATTYPNPSDLAALRRDASALPDARQRLAEVRDSLQRRSTLAEKLDDARRSLAEESAGLPEGLDTPKHDHDRLAAEARAAKSGLDALRVEARRADADLDRHRRAQDERAGQVADLARALAAAEGRREATLAALDRDRQSLPEPWRPLADAATAGEASAFRRELDGLERGGIEARAARLHEARTHAEPKRSLLADLDRRLADVPADALRPPAELADRLDAARADRDRLDRALLDAGRVLDQLRRHRADRLALDADALAADKASATAGRLAELLGPRHLQRHLVREAEEGILRFADDLLDRLSGGQLTLRLRKPDPDVEARFDRALDLEAYNRETKQAISVPFLSGSQRFRVAVALALGIGRYAGRLHRPIESVIIDEGFGCLDREGLAVMIRELQNLRQHVRRIILVSHQDELAAAFAEGYKLEVRDGTTVATRFSA